MAPVLRLDDDIELGALDRGVVEEALVMDLDDVAGMLADHPREAGEGTRHIRQLATQADEPALAYQAAHQDRGEQPRIHVAAGDHDADPPAGKALGCSEHGGDASGTGTLDHELLPLEQGLDGTFEHDLVDEPDLRDESLDDAPRQPARLLDRDPLCQGRGCGGRPGVLAAQQAVHRGVECDWTPMISISGL